VVVVVILRRLHAADNAQAARLFSQLSHSDLREVLTCELEAVIVWFVLYCCSPSRQLEQEEISKFITMQEVVVIGVGSRRVMCADLVVKIYKYVECGAGRRCAHLQSYLEPP